MNTNHTPEEATAMTTTTTRPELIDIKNEDGTQRMAGPGGVRQTGGSRPVKECGACRGAVAFVESKSGKWYLADCFTNRSGGYYYVKGSPHFKTCGQRTEEQAEMRRIQDEQEARAEEGRILREKMDLMFDALHAWEREQDAAGHQFTKDEYVAKRIELMAKYVD